VFAGICVSVGGAREINRSVQLVPKLTPSEPALGRHITLLWG